MTTLQGTRAQCRQYTIPLLATQEPQLSDYDRIDKNNKPNSWHVNQHKITYCIDAQREYILLIVYFLIDA